MSLAKKGLGQYIVCSADRTEQLAGEAEDDRAWEMGGGGEGARCGRR